MQDRAAKEDWQSVLDSLQSERGRVLILVEDSDLGWRLLTSAAAEGLRQLLEDAGNIQPASPSRLCYNLEETAELVGVSVQKVSTWVHRTERPLPHIQDGRRIIIPVALLTEWLREEASTNAAFISHGVP